MLDQHTWRKSQRSGHGECVEVRVGGTGEVEVRDSKDPDGARLRFDPQVWGAFLGDLRDGRFDEPGR